MAWYLSALSARRPIGVVGTPEDANALVAACALWVTEHRPPTPPPDAEIPPAAYPPLRAPKPLPQPPSAPRASLRILCLAEVARQVGYARQHITKQLALDESEGTPGLRFPLPLKDPLGRPRGKGVPLEWDAQSVRSWIEGRRGGQK